jgi:hypothetical protein
MEIIKTYPQSPSDIDINKITWQFWQSSFSYNINNQFVCLFNCDTKAIDKYGNPTNKLGGMNITYKAFGAFSLYKIFKMSNGQYGIDKGKPLKIISISSDSEETIDDFKKMGIFECLNQYLKEI